MGQLSYPGGTPDMCAGHSRLVIPGAEWYVHQVRPLDRGSRCEAYTLWLP